MNLKEALVYLGDDANTVANTLRRNKIKGKRGRSDCCPVANFITSCGFANVKVHLDKVYVACPHIDGSRIMVQEEKLSHGAMSFIAFFDNRHYPDLISE